jgi:hypothetical protein
MFALLKVFIAPNLSFRDQAVDAHVTRAPPPA